MIDELTIYNLSIKHPNTIDLVREVEKMARADVIEEMKTLIFQFDDYCDSLECSDCWMNCSDYWMNASDKSCFKQWINRKFEQIKEQINE